MEFGERVQIVALADDTYVLGKPEDVIAAVARITEVQAAECGLCNNPDKSEFLFCGDEISEEVAARFAEAGLPCPVTDMAALGAKHAEVISNGLVADTAQIIERMSGLPTTPGSGFSVIALHRVAHSLAERASRGGMHSGGLTSFSLTPHSLAWARLTASCRMNWRASSCSCLCVWGALDFARLRAVRLSLTGAAG